jgi:hypothetical protein
MFVPDIIANKIVLHFDRFFLTKTKAKQGAGHEKPKTLIELFKATTIWLSDQNIGQYL